MARAYDSAAKLVSHAHRQPLTKRNWTMAIVTEISWDDILDGKPLPETPARKIWREAVEEIAEKARTKLPECNGRVNSAVKIVLAGGVELMGHGTPEGATQGNGHPGDH